MTPIRKRRKLKKWRGRRVTVRGTFGEWRERFPSFLVTDIVHAGTGQPLCQHAWVRATPGDTITAQPGDTVQFRAFIHAYNDGSALGLSRPINFKILQEAR